MLSEHLGHLVGTSHRSEKGGCAALSLSLSLSPQPTAPFCLQAFEENVLGARTTCGGASNEMFCVFEQLFWIGHFHGFEENT